MRDPRCLYHQTVHNIRPATLPEIEKITATMPEPYAAMILLASSCALRFGELCELRLRDVVLDPEGQRGHIRVQRAVVRVGGGYRVTTPKSDAGTRDVAIPPHLIQRYRTTSGATSAPSRTRCCSPATRWAPGTGHPLPQVLHAARAIAGRPDLRFHDLRHSGAVLAAATGATLAELMARLGHSTPQAALRYQHTAADRDQAIAEALSRIAQGA